jgi:putative phosphoesterase
MKLGILADVHCNHQALRIALDRLGEVDELLCLGDAVYQFRFSDEVMDLLRERTARYILGNHEEVLLGPWGERARSYARRDNLAYMASQPYRLETRVDGKRLLAVHASPFAPENEYIYPNANLARFAALDVDYVLLGHTHYQMAQRAGRVLVVNPGSAGEARDHRNGFRLSVAVLDTETEEVRFEQFDDPTRLPVDPAVVPRASDEWRQEPPPPPNVLAWRGP